MNNIDPFLILYVASLFLMYNGIKRSHNKKTGCFSTFALIISLILGLLVTLLAIDFYILHRGSESMAYGVYTILFFPSALFFNLCTFSKQA